MNNYSVSNVDIIEATHAEDYLSKIRLGWTEALMAETRISRSAACFSVGEYYQ